MLYLLSQTPQTPLSGDWAIYIIGGLAFAVVSMAFFIKILFNTAGKAVSIAWTDLKNMHDEGMKKIEKIEERGIKNEGSLSEIKTDLKEAKYSIQTLSRSVKCKERIRLDETV